MSVLDETLATQLGQLLRRVEPLLPPLAESIDWSAPAFIWRVRQGYGWLEPVYKPHRISFAALQNVDHQKARIRQNTLQFLQGKSANNILLTGARGTGKSSLVKALLTEFTGSGLRLIEVDKDNLAELPRIVSLLAERPEKFILFCDDLSFESGEVGYKALKSLLDGSIAGLPDNLLVYATSNRRHLMPEFMSENEEAQHDDMGELRPGEATEEKVSLSERFGLWLSFYPFNMDEYLAACIYWLRAYGVSEKRLLGARTDALQWAQARGSRSGRVAWQFARDFAGQGGEKKRGKGEKIIPITANVSELLDEVDAEFDRLNLGDDLT